MAEKKRSTGRQAGQRNGAAPSGEVPIQVMVPKAVRRQVALMGAERGENIRTLVLRGLQSIGIQVPDSELGDRRGRRR
jgi:trimethylamine:corrinoid methyltransferase-like protein